LVVDDDDAVRTVAMRCLTFYGLAAVGVGSGEEAIETLQRDSFDCVVLDLNMPTLSGSATLEGLRADNPTLPVLLASGGRGDEVDRLLLRFEKLSFLDKPYTPSRLVGAIRSLCQA
jgi:CheY-like chemotaxis protein